MRRPRARCPRCHALERHRLLAILLDGLAPALQEHGRVLDVAPSRYVTPRLERIAPAHYVRIDLDHHADAREIDLQASLTELPFPDDSFDLIICFHVLEHIPDDATAISELHRVLRAGGVAIVQVPIRFDRPTDEDPMAPADERVVRFGQADHVRAYGSDFEARLERAGLSGIRVTARELLGGAAAGVFSIPADTVVWILRPSADGGGGRIRVDGGFRLRTIDQLARLARDQHRELEQLRRERARAEARAERAEQRAERILGHPAVRAVVVATRPARRALAWLRSRRAR